MPLMDLIDRQRAGAQVGEIRLGMKTEGTNKNGQTVTFPKKLETFRFTTGSRPVADSVADLYGGEVTPWDRKWQVLTTVSAIDVTIPPAEVISQWWEKWGGGLERRCDGVTIQRENKPCVCPLDLLDRSAMAVGGGDACKPITRLNVILPGVADIGVWLLSSTGMNAAIQLGSKAMMMLTARERGIALRAQLRLEYVEKTVARKLRKFVVPKLDILDSLAEIESGALDGTAGTLRLGTAPERQAITAGAPVAQRPVTAQELADRAQVATWRGEIKVIADLAAEQLLSDDHVCTDPSLTLYEPLADFLRARWADLPGSSEVTS